jgi:pyruvate ferredoxin oxidoreductase delta subunit
MKEKVAQKEGWRELAIGTIITEPGSALNFKTGDWRSQKPVWHQDKCISCLQCFIYCPDNSVKVSDEGKMAGINLDYCKGCGICAVECPKKAIEMEIEKR